MGEASTIKAGEAYIELSTRRGAKWKRGLDEATRSLSNVFRAGKWIGAAGFTAIAFATHAAIEFEAQMANVSTMLDEVGMKSLPELTKGIKELAVESGQSTGTLSSGLYNILSAGIDVSKSMDVLAVTSRAAVGGMTDTASATDATTTILNAFKLSANQAASVSDLLFAVVKRGKTTYGELASAIGRVASTAAVAGLSQEQMGAFLATTTRNGIKTHEAIVSLNAVLNAFLTAGTEARETARKYHFEMNSATLSTIGLTGVVGKLQEATAEELAILFPSIRALKGFAAAVNDAAGFQKDLALMTNRAGMAQEAFAKQSKTVAFQLGQMKQEAHELMVDVGDIFIPKLRSMIGWLHENKVAFQLVWIEGKQAMLEAADGADRLVSGLRVGIVNVGGWFGSMWDSTVAGFSAVIFLVDKGFNWLTENGEKRINWLVRKYNQIVPSRMAISELDLSALRVDTSELEKTIKDRMGKALAPHDVGDIMLEREKRLKARQTNFANLEKQKERLLKGLEGRGSEKTKEAAKAAGKAADKLKAVLDTSSGAQIFGSFEGTRVQSLIGPGTSLASEQLLESKKQTGLLQELVRGRGAGALVGSGFYAGASSGSEVGLRSGFGPGPGAGAGAGAGFGAFIRSASQAGSGSSVGAGLGSVADIGSGLLVPPPSMLGERFSGVANRFPLPTVGGPAFDPGSDPGFHPKGLGFIESPEGVALLKQLVEINKTTADATGRIAKAGAGTLR